MSVTFSFVSPWLIILIFDIKFLRCFNFRLCCFSYARMVSCGERFLDSKSLCACAKKFFVVEKLKCEHFTCLCLMAYIDSVNLFSQPFLSSNCALFCFPKPPLHADFSCGPLGAACESQTRIYICYVTTREEKNCPKGFNINFLNH